MMPNFQVGQSLPFLPFSVIRIGGLNSSVILTSLDYNNYTGKLLSYLEPVFLSSEQSRFVKCWHAKTDGWAASTFHSNCDGRGPTVTIIKVNDYIFGGYTDVSWSGGRHIKFLKRRRTLEEILNDASLILALSLYYFILVFWPSRFLQTYIVYRNVSYLIHLQNNTTS